MKKAYVYFFIVALISLNVNAQDPGDSKSKEIYLSGNLLTFSDFAFQYKTELRNNTYFRIGLARLSPNFYKSNPGSPTAYETSTLSVSGSIDLGIEKRKQISENLILFSGINLYTGSGFNRSKTEDPSLPLDLRHEDNFNINSGLGFNSGFILKLMDNIALSAEIMPRLLIVYNSSQNVVGTNKIKDTKIGGSFNFDTYSFRVSFIYKWIKSH